MDLSNRRETANVEDRRHLREDSVTAKTMRNLRMKGSPSRQWSEIAYKVNDRSNWEGPLVRDSGSLEDLEEYELGRRLEEDGKKLRESRTPSSSRKDKTNVNIGRRRSLEGEDLGEYKMRNK